MEPRPPSDELRRNVHADERIQWVVQPKTSARLATEATGAIIGGTVSGGVVAAGAFYGLTELLGEPAALATPVAVVAFVLVLALSLRRSVARALFGTFEYAATDARLIRFEGVFGRTLTSVPFDGVQDAQYDISGTEKMFDVGTVSVDTERGYETMQFPYTSSPAEFAKAVTSLAKETRDAPDTEVDATYDVAEDFRSETPEDGLEANLYPDEDLLWVRTPNKTSRLLRNLPGVVVPSGMLGAVVGAAAGVASTLASGSTDGAILAGVGVGAVVFLLVAAANAYGHLRGATQYAATDRRIVEYENRWGKRFDSIPLRGVQDAEYGVSFTENVFDVGSVTLDTDLGYETLALADIDDPASVSRELSRLATSDLGVRRLSDPEDVAVGDGVESTDPTDDLVENLHADESPLWTITPDKSARLLAGAVTGFPGLAFVALFLGGFAGVFAAQSTDVATGVVAGGGVAAGIFVLGYGNLISEYLFETTEYALTDDRIVDYSGRFGRTLAGVPLSGVQDAEYRVGFVEDWFGVGDVTIDTDRGTEPMTLNAVANPSVVARELSEAANANRFAGAESSDAEEGDSSTATSADAPDASSGGAASRDRRAAATAENATSVAAAPARKRCPSCDAVVDGTASFCPDCGTEQPGRPDGLERTCSDCGDPIAATDAYCQHCGHAQPN